MDAGLHPDRVPLADAGLRCPKCEYNLTGLAEDRCPECGEAFDREQLRLIAEGRPGPIPGWDDMSNPVIAFVGTCLRTWFAPMTTGRTFPSIHNPKSLNRFKAATLGVSLCTFLLIYAQLSSTVQGIHILIGIAVGVSLCERWARDVLGLCFRKLPGSKDRSDVWSGLTGLHRSFLLISSLAPASTILLGGRMMLLTFLGMIAWWSVSLTMAAVSRGFASWRAVPAIFLLWVVAGAAIATGGFGGMVVGGLIIEPFVQLLWR